jgi:AraC-like DNA-binding protein
MPMQETSYHSDYAGPARRVRQSRAKESREGLIKARDFIAAHYTRRIALAQLSGIAGISRFHLVRAFARSFGLPPHKYQLRLQLEHARALLADGVRPISAAAECGFSDQSHLARHFKRIYNVTPGSFARASRQSQEGLTALQLRRPD